MEKIIGPTEAIGFFTYSVLLGCYTVCQRGIAKMKNIFLLHCKKLCNWKMGNVLHNWFRKYYAKIFKPKRLIVSIYYLPSPKNSFPFTTTFILKQGSCAGPRIKFFLSTYRSIPVQYIQYTLHIDNAKYYGIGGQIGEITEKG